MVYPDSTVLQLHIVQKQQPRNTRSGKLPFRVCCACIPLARTFLECRCLREQALRNSDAPAYPTSRHMDRGIVASLEGGSRILRSFLDISCLIEDERGED